MTPKMAKRIARKRLRESEKRQEELIELLNMERAVEAGQHDHLFADVETKAAFLEMLKAEANALIEAELRANPGLYRPLPGGRRTLVADSERAIIPLTRKPPA
jgi:hypothetical protein